MIEAIRTDVGGNVGIFLVRFGTILILYICVCNTNENDFIFLMGEGLLINSVAFSTVFKFILYEIVRKLCSCLRMKLLK